MILLNIKLELWQSLLLWAVAIGGYFAWRFFVKSRKTGKRK